MNPTSITGQQSLPEIHAAANTTADRRASITNLPTEILSLIIYWAVQDDDEYRYRDLDRCYAVSLSRVCWRFNSVAKPYVYRRIRLGSALRVVPWTSYDRPLTHVKSFELLHYAFRQNPKLWNLCQDIAIDMQRFRDHLYIATDLMTWMSGITELGITLRERDSWRDFSVIGLAFKNMPQLKSFTLDGTYPDRVSLPMVISALGDLSGNPGLRKLHIRGISRDGNPEDWDKLKSLAGTAPFTQLELDAFLQTPQALQALVEWPAALERFRLDKIYASDYGMPGKFTDWGIATMQPILSAHKNRLKSISLRGFNRSGLRGVNLLEFSNLQELELSQNLTDSDTAGLRFLIPLSLRSLHWDMTLEDQQVGERITHFGEPEETWLRTFADCAIDNGGKFENILITFNPSSENIENTRGVYPWDRMDKLATDIKPHGISLSYNPPSMSKDEFVEEYNEALEWNRNPERFAELLANMDGHMP